MFRPIHGTRSAFDPVSDLSEHCWEQVERGQHGDDADGDRSDGEALHHVRGHEQHPAQRDHEHRAAEQHRAVRGRPATAIASSSARPPARSSR